MTSAVVLRLINRIQGRGHHLYMDILYTSPRLFTELHQQGFEACGTLQLNRRGVPPEVKNPMGKGETRMISVDESISFVQWNDRRIVSMVKTQLR